MQIQTELNPLVEGVLGFSGAVDVQSVLRLHAAILVVQSGLNDSIADSLKNAHFQCFWNAPTELFC